MLEARDFDSIDMVSTFLEAIVDIGCGTEEEELLTKCFTLYVDLVEFLFSRSPRHGWNETCLKRLGQQMREFKKSTQDFFQRLSIIWTGNVYTALSGSYSFRHKRYSTN